LKKKVVEFFQNFRSNCSKLFDLVQKNIDKILKSTPDQLKVIVENFKKFIDSFYLINKHFITKLVEKMKIGDIIDYSWK